MIRKQRVRSQSGGYEALADCRSHRGPLSLLLLRRRILWVWFVVLWAHRALRLRRVTCLEDEFTATALEDNRRVLEVWRPVTASRYERRLHACCRGSMVQERKPDGYIQLLLILSV